jgi:hypothetical protein
MSLADEEALKRGPPRQSQLTELSGRQGRLRGVRVSAASRSRRARSCLLEVAYPGLIIHDLDKAAGVRVVETETVGPVLKEWHPLKEMHKANSSAAPQRGQQRRHGSAGRLPQDPQVPPFAGVPGGPLRG